MGRDLLATAAEPAFSPVGAALTKLTGVLALLTAVVDALYPSSSQLGISGRGARSPSLETLLLLIPLCNASFCLSKGLGEAHTLLI